ncbi:MAG: hypothetical protein RLN70_01120 [Rhodospirillaceae bacterium]
MTYISRDLAVLAYADGYTLWHYSTEDSALEVLQPGYFDDAREIFRTNDRIEVLAGDGDFDARISIAGRVRLKR